MTILPLLSALLMPGPLGDRLISDELGVAVTLPAEQLVVQRPGDSGSHFLIRDGHTPPTWSLRIESRDVQGADAEACLGTVLKQSNPARTMPPEGLQLLRDQRNRPMATAWVQETAHDGRTVALGWLVAPQTLGRCLILTAVTTADSKGRETLDRVFESVELMDRAADGHALAAGLKVGQTILNSITEQHLRDLIGRAVVLRIHDPNAPACGEIAYGTLEVTAAPRSAIRTRPGPISEAENEEGLLVTSHLRFADDPETDTYSDRVQRCWVSWDLQREAWVDSITRRRNDERSSQEEIAIKSPPDLGLPRGQLLVIRQDAAHGTRNTWTLVPERPWLPRALRWLVWDLPAAAHAEPAIWHVWDETTTTPRVTYRRDIWDPNLPARRCWTWSGIDGIPTSLSFDSDGIWTQANRPGGAIIETSDRETVTRRWEAAGLKMR